MNVNKVTNPELFAKYLLIRAKYEREYFKRDQLAWYLENYADWIEYHSSLIQFPVNDQKLIWRELAYIIMASIRHMNIADGYDFAELPPMPDE